ncbi:related to a putative low-affinity copper transport protein [Phialocephala subalpina]|uniref:Copper transport protein n=1 Tax=Phialocephala subalpina TaxID=576137 RepID=A0A1L7WDR2_9HELO|nr:related to a putative low-affinity copper transport protein [Phialocephala subalpina]
MDHSHMDHSAMGHNHGDMAMPAMCSMNVSYQSDSCSVIRSFDANMDAMQMLFTWDTKNLCIIFRWWHVQTTPGLIFSLLAVVALTAAYEALRSASRRYENWVAKRTDEVPPEMSECGVVTERTPFLWSGRNQVEVSKRAHVIKALLYAVQNFYAFMLMLLFMTYNGWVMLSVGVGAFVGYLIFGNNTSATKDGACH